MTLAIAPSVTAALLFLIVTGPIILFVATNNYLSRGANSKTLEKMFIVLFGAVLVDGAMTLAAVVTDVPVKAIVAEMLTDFSTVVVDAGLVQDTLYGSCLAVCTALTIALAKQLAAARFARVEQGYR